jgi:2,3-bisphosphoglycerate-dependent phosphoglycerate mutase
MALRRVYLIRHGQTAWNVEGRWQGFEAVPLNPVGLAQARALAANWREPLSAIYSSDLARAWQTAEILGTAVRITPTPDQRLREFHLGIFQGLTWQEMQDRYPTEADQFHADYMGYAVPDGESRYQLQARAYAAWEDIVAGAQDDVAIVSHGGTLKVLLFKLFGETPELHALRIENTSITTIERNGAGWHLAGANDAAHLELVQPTNDEGNFGAR